MTLKKIILATLISTASFTAFAEEKTLDDNQYFIQLNGGLSKSLKPSGGFKNSSPGNAGIFGIEGGYKINDNFRTSLSIDYLTDVKNKFSYNTDLGYGVGGNNHLSFKTQSWVVMANAYYDIMEYHNFTPYITAGLGIARNKTSGTDKLVPYSLLGNADPEYSSPRGTKTNFAYKIGFGSRFLVSKEIDLDLRYQFADLGKISARDSDETYKGKLKAHEFLVGIAYKF
jgi:opacity protein-like surface antigen